MPAILELNQVSKYYPLNFWGSKKTCALEDINLSIQSGESWGIIGRNGAGKSTLLKLLAGITQASSGTILRKGKVASLIELGAGFHSDLSGMENLKFNAALLGMSRNDISLLQDEIIAFAGLEDVIHQPIRTYSTGMTMRLAFSIAAHVNTDIILLDEVLAVGDSFFQQKCSEKIQGLNQAGRTILLVSHQADSIRNLCKHAAWLHQGKLLKTGPTPEVLNSYLGLDTLEATQKKTWDLPLSEYGFLDAEWLQYPIQTNQIAQLRLTISTPQPAEIDLGININDKNGNCLMHFSNRFLHQTILTQPGLNQVLLQFQPPLIPDNYGVSLFLRSGHTIHDWKQNCLEMPISGAIHDKYENPSEIQGPVLSNFTILPIT
ncbi:MAG: ATP-binding cassette domain-containing protein [Bacteroidia bacterium]|nr:ATP-binding cassette domain-containing protein [Bacteroidia bacterium]